jgi:uncharacterized membrane protein YsdA (DUF1294 family)
MKQIVKILFIVYLIFSIISFLLYYQDKKKAIHSKRRIPERVLLLSTQFFGSVGTFFGIFLLRHKTKHWYFVANWILAAAWQIGLLIYFILG